MSYEYKPPNKLGYKDTLAPNHPEKIIRGEEFDDEFNNIAFAIQNLRSDVDDAVGGDTLSDAPNDGETYGRKSGLWTYVAEKVHSHEIGNIDGLGDFVNNHTHPIADVEDLQDQLDSINNALSTITTNLVFGGSYDLENDVVLRSTKESEGLVEGQPLPADGVIFDTFMILVSGGTMKGETLARGDWIVSDGTGTWIPIPYSIAESIDWGNIQGLPDFDALYAPFTHYHPQYLEDAPTDGDQYCRKSGSWAQITGIKGDKGDGWTGGSYDPSSGRVTFTSDDGLGFITGDLRGADGADGADGASEDGRITDTQISNWDTAYNWGNHATAGYLTSHQSLSGYATQSWVSSNYQVKGSYLTSESDPTVPSWVKSITQANINSWNAAAGGGGDPFPWTGVTAQFNSSGENATIKMRSGAGRGPEIQWEHTGGQKKYLRMTSSSNLEVVNSAYSAVIFTVNDTGNVYCADVHASSDERLKDNITTVPVGFIESLKGREWDWKKSGEKGSGVVAQELEEVFPHLVEETDDGMKTVNYNGLVAYLIEELKDCRQRLAVLEEKS